MDTKDLVEAASRIAAAMAAVAFQAGKLEPATMTSIAEQSVQLSKLLEKVARASY